MSPRFLEGNPRSPVPAPGRPTCGRGWRVPPGRRQAHRDSGSSSPTHFLRQKRMPRPRGREHGSPGDDSPSPGHGRRGGERPVSLVPQACRERKAIGDAGKTEGRAAERGSKAEQSEPCGGFKKPLESRGREPLGQDAAKTSNQAPARGAACRRGAATVRKYPCSCKKKKEGKREKKSKCLGRGPAAAVRRATVDAAGPQEPRRRKWPMPRGALCAARPHPRPT